MDWLFASFREALLSRRAAIERRLEDGISDEERAEVDDIDAALARIELGGFGRCERCGHAIGLQRLRAVPEGRLCDGCASGLSAAAR